MEVFANLTAQLETIISSFMLAVGRLSPIIFLMPGIGDQFLSVRVKLLVLLGFSASVVLANIVPPVSIDPFVVFLPTFLIEVLTGLKMGVLLRATIWILMIVGNVIANMIGLSQLVGVATNAESQTVLGNMFALAGTTLLLTMDLHIFVFAEVVKSYEVSAPLFQASLDAPAIANALSKAFTFAIVLAWPFVAASLIYNLCLGFINRAMPQLMVAFVGAPFIIGAGFLLLVMSLSGILLVWQDRSLSILGIGMG